MSWWSRLIGGKSDRELKPKRLDYLSEALALERQGDLDAALTSYRLALRDKPDDVRVLQNMAIAYSRTARLEEAIRCWKRVLELDPHAGAAHYGLAFLLLKRGDVEGTAHHLRLFLARAPRDSESASFVRHAEDTLARLEGSEGAGGGEEAGEAGAWTEHER